MEFNSADLGNSRLNDFEGVTDLDMKFEADEGDFVLSLVQVFGDLNMVLQYEATEEEVRPVLFSRVTSPEGESVFARAYQVARKGVYRLRVWGNQAAVTVIKFGQDILDYVKRKGDPTRGTCFFCTKTLVIVMLLATHAFVIPAGQTVLASLLVHYKNAATMLKELRALLPHYLIDFITAAVETVFSDAPRIPRYLIDPLGETAKHVCKGLNWCSP